MEGHVDEYEESDYADYREVDFKDTWKANVF